ncbi:MerR family transcriptional regulator [Actinomadura citrea]|uniref:DNA-binding transcriptional MerR regulator n=1 Tax=Actinomadura citrea TaxID=46158 RepID=A0A7Y9GE54_9ACTN|nr:MerR family transcriptional regulator [Actinomadura citrea]NYE14836.1 DNA-binding transcriptional MerR regulator [Actinomadura citrea]GGT82527.1 MerR family transcriptional regulator [Actinomadura citrea]
MSGLKSRGLRTIDVARRTGYSVQQVRNLERDGVLPPAVRTATGYRVYGEPHVQSALAYRALAAGAGPVEAKKIVRAAHRFPAPDVLVLLDAAHAGLDAERTRLRQAREAAQAISDEPVGDVRASDAMSVSELAAALGVRPSTLRHWDAEDLVVPDRGPVRGARRYTPAQVRDARVVHQLRQAGHRIASLRALMPELRAARGTEDVASALDARDAGLAARSKALLDGAAALSAVLSTVTSATNDAAEATRTAAQLGGSGGGGGAGVRPGLRGTR